MSTIQQWPTFKVGDQVFTIQMNFQAAYKLVDKFDFNIITLFLNEEETEKTMMRLLLDNEFSLKLMWHLIENKFNGDYDKLLEKLETAAELDPFRDALWSAVVLFSSPQLRELLRQSWERLKKDLKKVDLDSLISTKSLSEPSQEESTSAS